MSHILSRLLRTIYSDVRVLRVEIAVSRCTVNVSILLGRKRKLSDVYIRC